MPKDKKRRGKAAAEKKDAHVDTTVATFTCTHKQWKGQMELMTNGQFRRVDKDGGNWTIAWDARETDDEIPRLVQFCWCDISLYFVIDGCRGVASH